MFETNDRREYTVFNTQWAQVFRDPRVPWDTLKTTGGAVQVGRLLRRHELCAQGRQRLPDRREIASTVVNQRNHNNPFVLGNIFASRLSFAQATRSARANALNTASM